MANKEPKDLRGITLHEYAQATKHYAVLVSELSKKRASLTREDYAAMYQIVEDARMECERLRRDLAKFRD